jgi:hypothetical protein
MPGLCRVTQVSAFLRRFFRFGLENSGRLGRPGPPGRAKHSHQGPSRCIRAVRTSERPGPIGTASNSQQDHQDHQDHHQGGQDDQARQQAIKAAGQQGSRATPPGTRQEGNPCNPSRRATPGTHPDGQQASPVSRTSRPAQSIGASRVTAQPRQPLHPASQGQQGCQPRTTAGAERSTPTPQQAHRTTTQPTGQPFELPRPPGKPPQPCLVGAWVEGVLGQHFNVVYLDIERCQMGSDRAAPRPVRREFHCVPTRFGAEANFLGVAGR